MLPGGHRRLDPLAALSRLSESIFEEAALLRPLCFLLPVALLAAAPVHASECARMGFSVNDYGKEGPARDAQALLDKHIKSEMDKKGVKGYRTGPKSVKCDMFLDFGVFDEYTCVASAEVCWGDGPVTRTSAPAAVKKAPARKPAQ
jgi:hypothetical protein